MWIDKKKHNLNGKENELLGIWSEGVSPVHYQRRSSCGAYPIWVYSERRWRKCASGKFKAESFQAVNKNLKRASWEPWIGCSETLSDATGHLDEGVRPCMKIMAVIQGTQEVNGGSTPNPARDLCSCPMSLQCPLLTTVAVLIQSCLTYWQRYILKHALCKEEKKP